MAVTVQGSLTFRMVDSQGIHGSLNMPVLVDTAQTLTQAQTAWLTQALLLDAVTSAQIIGGRVTVSNASLAGLKAAPAADSRIQETGNLDFGVTGVPGVYDSIIPSISDAVLVGGVGPQIDEANAAMIPYIGSITGAILGGHFTNRDFLVLTALVDSFLSDRKRRRKLAEASRRRP